MGYCVCHVWFRAFGTIGAEFGFFSKYLGFYSNNMDFVLGEGGPKN
jgi:hypothetical protein